MFGGQCRDVYDEGICGLGERLWFTEPEGGRVECNCDEVEYKKRIQALCQEHCIPLVMVPDNMRLGRIAAYGMLDTEGNKIKGVPCSSMVVHSHDWKWSTDKGAFIIEWVLKKKPLL